MESAGEKKDSAGDPAKDEPGKLPVPPPQRRLSATGFLVSVLIALSIVAILLRLTNVSPSIVLETLRGVSPIALLLGFVLHLVTYLMRCIRFRLLIHSARPSISSLFEIVTVHNLMNHVLPFSAGELSYFYLIRSLHGVPLGEGLGTLAICRIMDLMALALYYPFAIILLYLQGFTFPSYIWAVLWTAVPIFFLLATLLIVLAFKGKALVRFLRHMAAHGPWVDSRWFDRIVEMLEETAYSFQQLEARNVLLRTFLLSLAILGLAYLIGYVLLAGMGYRMQILLVIFCSTIASIAVLLPLHSFGGFGTLEAGWTAGCLLAGFSKEMGMASGFSFHIILLGYVSLLGIVGLARVGRAGWAWNRPEANGAEKEEVGIRGDLTDPPADSRSSNSTP